MLWVEMEVNSGAVKHMVELIWCVDEVDDTTLADLHDIWWFWWRLQTRYIHLIRRLVIDSLSEEESKTSHQRTRPNVPTTAA